MPDQDPLPLADPGTRSEAWDALSLELPDSLADEFAGALALQGLGAECLPLGAARTRVRVILRSEKAAREVERRALLLLDAFGIPPGDCALRRERIPDERWVERYVASLRPIPLGSRFLVEPGRLPAPSEDRVRIVLRPGRAFGTGEHATTQLCVEQLEGQVESGSRWLDLGCGTAILSIVARRCGAEEVLALDTDPDAVDVAGEVLRANGMGPGIDVRIGSLADVPDRDFDGIVANIHLPFFLERAPLLAERLREGGVLVASGFLAADLPEVAPAFRGAGFDELGVFERSPWIAWSGRLSGTVP